MAQVYISIGSNIDAERKIREAVSALQQYFGNVELSSVYESEAVGFDGDNFLNLVAGVSTDQDIERVNGILHKIEDEYGRTREGPRFSSRTIDLDLLLYDDVIYHQNGIQIPRDEILKNAFVLQPLAELAPGTIHPEQNKTMQALWDVFDKSAQQLWAIDFDWNLS